MKTFIDEVKKECILTLTELKTIDVWTKVVDLKPLGKVLNALRVLGKDVTNIYIHNVYFDIDTIYYRRFPEEIINRLWRNIEKNGMEQEVHFKNNRVYIFEEEFEIICPEGMHDKYSDYDNPELSFIIRWK